MNKSTYQVVSVPVSKIKPDKNQPRKIFKKEEIKNLATSIKRHGVIKNIEVTPEYTIITGENRWRAAKLAGLKEMPCRILKIETNGGLRERQLVENIQHIAMNPLDIARSLGELEKNNPKLGGQELANLVGKDRDWYLTHINILKFPAFIQKQILLGEITSETFIRAISPLHKAEKEKKIPAGTTKTLLEKYKKNPHVGVKTAREAMYRISANPTLASKILAMSWKGKNPELIKEELDEIAPSAEYIGRSAVSLHKLLWFTINKLDGLLKRTSFKTSGLRRNELKNSLKETKRLIDDWLEN